MISVLKVSGTSYINILKDSLPPVPSSFGTPQNVALSLTVFVTDCTTQSKFAKVCYLLNNWKFIIKLTVSLLMYIS